MYFKASCQIRICCLQVKTQHHLGFRRLLPHCLPAYVDVEANKIYRARQNHDLMRGSAANIHITVSSLIAITLTYLFKVN